jgi:hypothetical protein
LVNRAAFGKPYSVFAVGQAEVLPLDSLSFGGVHHNFEISPQFLLSDFSGMGNLELSNLPGIKKRNPPKQYWRISQ